MAKYISFQSVSLHHLVVNSSGSVPRLYEREPKRCKNTETILLMQSPQNSILSSPVAAAPHMNSQEHNHKILVTTVS